MNSGYKISHDSEKRNPKTGLKEYYADEGRFGDDRIGIVDDEPAHINAWEEYLLDTHGEIGEEIVKTIGSGTINPETGMDEYHYKGWSPVNAHNRAHAADLFNIPTGSEFIENVQYSWEYLTPSGHTDWLSHDINQEWHDSQAESAQLESVTASTIRQLGGDLFRSVGPGGSITKSAALDRSLISKGTSDQLTAERDRREQEESSLGFANIGQQKDFDFTESRIAMEKSYMSESEEKADLVSSIQKELNQIIMGYQEATGDVYSGGRDLDYLQQKLNELR